MGATSGFAPDELFVVPLHVFGSTSTICRFSERFRDGQYSLVSFQFAVLLPTAKLNYK